MLLAHHNGCAANGNSQASSPAPSAGRTSTPPSGARKSGTITPILYGHPWLEKPALYYWRTMSFFKEFGVSATGPPASPPATGAFGMVFLIFLHMRRFRPGGHLDAALITASATAIVAFARGASTDMQLAAPFAIGMLGWYAWYETGKKFWLFDLYFFGALATLAKGPVAPFLALCIIVLFVGLRREWQVLRRMIWIPGARPLPGPGPALVHRRPAPQPQLPQVLPLPSRTSSASPPTATSTTSAPGSTSPSSSSPSCPGRSSPSAPWATPSSIAYAEWRTRYNRQPLPRPLPRRRRLSRVPRPLGPLPRPLLFTFSGSKLPGYILPAIPPLTILTGDYLFRARTAGLRLRILVGHGVTHRHLRCSSCSSHRST